MILRTLLALAATVPLAAPVAAQTSAVDSLLRHAGYKTTHEHVVSFVQSPIQVKPSVVAGIGSVEIFGYLQTKAGKLHSEQLFHAADGKVFVDAAARRVIWERKCRLGPLHVRVSVHYTEGDEHVEGSILLLNSESVSPVGNIPYDWLGIGVMDGAGTFIVRNSVPLTLEPFYLPNDRNVSTWKFNSADSQIRAADMKPIPFLIGFGSYKYNANAYRYPAIPAIRGEFFVPAPELDASDVAAHLKNSEKDWLNFNFDKRAWSDPSHLFGEYKFTGSSGSQPRFGKHATMRVTHPKIRSGFAADQMRAVTMWTEGRRKYWLDWPTEPNKAYNFYGLHWTSKWKAGYVRNPDGSWAPPFGPDHGVTGHNLEHLRSRLPELAYYTRDPQLMWMTSRLARVIMCTITRDGISGGGYYGGGFSSFRGIGRPLVELMECFAALVSYPPYVDFAKTVVLPHIAHKLQWLVDNYPRFERTPTRSDEQIPDHVGEEITELWQLGLAGDYFYSWFKFTGDTNALQLATACQMCHVEGWKGTSRVDLAMPKQVLAADWSIGRKHHRRHDFLVGWNLSLMMIPDIPGVPQDRRKEIVGAIEIEYPGARYGVWGAGDWAKFQPMLKH